ncbi:MAG: tRNA glutamyl-Q(34) synthetase GluQRS [Verrucomicrobia bacterium]|nr:tRNA glutamyl-Q(34) synthetase GluQRS [Verrucomicrobiota bacterium]
MSQEYRGRIAPSPTGFLHLGHAMTFCAAQERACAAGGKLVLRIEDIDYARCRGEFRSAIIDDLHWFGVRWDEGPDIGGPYAPYVQSERRAFYLQALHQLREAGFAYPCTCSRKDVLSAAGAPHDENEEPIYPGICRNSRRDDHATSQPNWRFHVPDGEQLEFEDVRLGTQEAIAGRDFGDFIIWRRDDVPSYQLAVVVDDAAMRVTEVVRGEDLGLSTFRQLLLYRALELAPPRFFHTPLLRDATGQRLAKRNAALTLRALRAAGKIPADLRAAALAAIH